MSQIKLNEISEAITFTPNADEFKAPLEYIEKIRLVGEKYGICKIIPPPDWKPPFAIDMFNFKFRPRVQRLNELEANTRIKLNFLEKISKFWELQGKKFRVPIVEGRPLDIYRLHKMVTEQGGFETVSKNKRWAYLAKQLNYKDAYTCTTLKMHYENILYPYILFEAGVTLPSESAGRKAADAETRSKKKTNTNANLDQDKIEHIKCLVCERGDDEAFMLLCDGCDDSYHTFCLYPALKEIPKGEWRCPLCIAHICKKPSDAYGFGQSKTEYNLRDFGKMADKFKAEYFKKNCQQVSLEECEREFWRILASPDQTVEVEYGADLHTLETGSGFPTKSNRGKYKECFDAYVNSPWNLNNLSLLPKSVLSQMNVDISGMKIPWAYVGMCFSCFCWHVEDHWSYSINYLHMGEPKTWYGVSGLHADQFELAMKQSASELFDKSPDLLHHLVTIMDPGVLRQSGVAVHKIQQRAGEFVVTFPRAYHAGFNQGFNFAEAVNFCPADWMSVGRAAIENYKLVKRHTVFSHDELVCKVALNKASADLNVSLAVQHELKIMIDRETRERKLLLDKGVKHARHVNFELYSDDERTCLHCNTTCFISALVCSCRQDKLVCLDHYQHLCSVSTGRGQIVQSQAHKLTILHRYEMHQLCLMYNKLKQKTDEYFGWCGQVKTLLGINDDPDLQIIESDSVGHKPHFKMLLKLYHEAKDKQYPAKVFHLNKLSIDLFQELERELNRALAVAKVCKKYLAVFKSGQQSKESDDDVIFVKETSIRSGRPYLNDLKSVLGELDALKCELDEADVLRTLVRESVAYETRIKKMIDEWNLDLVEELTAVVEYLDRIEIEFPPDLVEQVSTMHKQAVWLDKVKKIEPNSGIGGLQKLVDEFVAESLMTRFGDTKSEIVQKNFVDLQELVCVAQSCDQKAAKLLVNANKRLEDLELLLDECRNVPIDMENVIKLQELVRKAQIWSQKVNQLVKTEPYVNDLKELLKENDQLQIKFDSVSILHTRLNLYSEWLFKLETTFLKSDSTKSILDILTPRLDLEHFNHKLQNSLKGCTSSSSSPILSEVAMSKYMTKRQREKSITLNSNTSRSDLLEPTIESSLDFYTNEANIDSLVEKYKSLQYKEIEFLKQSRRLNTERILLLKSFLQSVLQSPSEPINIKENPLNKIKCTSCTSSVLGRIFSSSPLNQCKLCLGLYCSVCNNVNLKQSKLKMAESADYLCPQCDRSKRPKLDTVVDFLVKFEKIQVRSFESNALQMFVNRALCWNEKYDKLTKELDGASSETRCERGESILDEKLNALKKQELHDLHIDGLLMEIDSAKVLRLSVLMEKIEANELAELRALCDKISDLKDKIQLVESSQSVAVVSSQVSSPGALSAIRPKPAKIEKVKMNKMGKVGGELSEPDKPKIKDSRSKKPRIRESDGLHPKTRKREISQVYDSDEEQCAALKCLKPMGDNIKWVQCDGDCQKWFHMACVGITKIKRREKYLCHSCTMTPDENSNSSSSASLNNGKSGSKSALEESMEPGQDEFKSEQDVNLSMSKMETDTTESANLNATIEIIE